MGGRQTFSRVDRVKKSLIREVSDIIANRIKNPILSNQIISVTDIDLSNDLRYAKIYISVMADEELRTQIMDVLIQAEPQIRSEVGRRVQLRYTPEIEILYDDSLERGTRITQLLEQISKEES